MFVYNRSYYVKFSFLCYVSLFYNFADINFLLILCLCLLLQADKFII